MWLKIFSLKNNIWIFFPQTTMNMQHKCFNFSHLTFVWNFAPKNGFSYYEHMIWTHEYQICYTMSYEKGSLVPILVLGNLIVI
jgi:hypothetical protein